MGVFPAERVVGVLHDAGTVPAPGRTAAERVRAAGGAAALLQKLQYRHPVAVGTGGKVDLGGVPLDDQFRDILRFAGHSHLFAAGEGRGPGLQYRGAAVFHHLPRLEVGRQHGVSVLIQPLLPVKADEGGAAHPFGPLGGEVDAGFGHFEYHAGFIVQGFRPRGASPERQRRPDGPGCRRQDFPDFCHNKTSPLRISLKGRLPFTGNTLGGGEKLHPAGNFTGKPVIPRKSFFAAFSSKHTGRPWTPEDRPPTAGLTRAERASHTASNSGSRAREGPGPLG